MHSKGARGSNPLVLPMIEKQTLKKAMPVSPGRPKGVPNKTTQLLKDAILQAAQDAGGGGAGGLVGYLTMQATENPTAFMSLLGKVLPLQVTGEGGGGVKLIVQTGVPRDDD